MKKGLIWESVQVYGPEDQNLNPVISDISVLVRETTLTISVSTSECLNGI